MKTIKEHIIYQGEKYWIQVSGRYYSNANRKAKPRLLHRKVWFDHHGEIPSGYVIHHKDHNWRNNDISNLELIERKKHLSDHAKENHKRLDYQAKNRIALNKAQEAAKEWHASSDGIEWHRKHGKESWEDRKKELATCSICKKSYETYFKSRKNARFCSRKCAQKEEYNRYFTETRKCAYCGSDFLANRHRKVACCSYTCSAKARWSMRKR